MIDTAMQEPQVVHSLQKPLALIDGQAFLELPVDLYIPPEALLIFLEKFEGPLDLLLYLIKKQNLDILNIPIAEVTRQYLQYMALMNTLQIELAAEYLLMAAMLAEIKSRLLLPKPVSLLHEDQETDPRAELGRRLLEYGKFKKGAEIIDELPRMERDIFLPHVDYSTMNFHKPVLPLALNIVVEAFYAVMKRAALFSEHQVIRETISVRECMSSILSHLEMWKQKGPCSFYQVCHRKAGRKGIIVSFLAILELVKQAMIQVIQHNAYQMILIDTLLLPDKSESKPLLVDTPEPVLEK